MEIRRLRPSGGASEQLTPPQPSLYSLAPLDSRTLLYVARAPDYSGPWLWTLDVVSKVTRRVISGLERYTSVSASRDGSRVVVTRTNLIASLWRIPLLDRPATDRDAEPMALPTVRALAPRSGGASLFYLSANGTADGLSRFQDGKAFEIWRGADSALAEPPAVSPDGQRIAVIERKAGKRHLTIMRADGTGARTLAASINIQGNADWSPDGNWIATAGIDAEGSGLFKIPVDGGWSASTPAQPGRRSTVRAVRDKHRRLIRLINDICECFGQPTAVAAWIGHDNVHYPSGVGRGCCGEGCAADDRDAGRGAIERHGRARLESSAADPDERSAEG